MKAAPFSVLFITLFVSLTLKAQTVHYIAHEWGTFTGLSGSDGTPLNGLYIEEEHLPTFVHNIGGNFPEIAYNFGKGLPSDVALAHVTIKMETPVIYFYSQNPFTADVKVQFTHGLIGQWYPDDSTGVSSIYYNSFGPVLDFGNKQSPLSNNIEWSAKVLPLSADPGLVTKTGETNTWTAPRATDANLVQYKSETEKFLFYRGIGNFDVPVNVSFDKQANLVIKNNYTSTIPYFFVYDKEESGAVKVWFSGAITSGASKTVSPASASLSAADFNAKLSEFQAALTSAGLYNKESAAMLNTWQTSYFGKTGLRVFWIVPRKFTDNILPITINPAPDSLNRVLIGRSEILTPQFEKQLWNNYQSDTTLSIYAGDRFFEAYKDRMAYLKANPAAVQLIDEQVAAAGIEQGIQYEGKIVLYPNPARTNMYMAIQNADNGNLSVSLIDMEGRNLINCQDVVSNNFYQKSLDISGLSNGVYFIRVQTGTQNYVAKMVKE